MGWALRTDQSALERSLGTQLRSWLETKTDSLTQAAITNCPVGSPDPLGRPREFPVRLKDSITGQVVGSGLDIRGRVTAATPYAKTVHDGSRPHQIRPRGTGYPLRFYWDKVGGVFRAMSVNHPGTQPQPFLREAAQQVLR